ncbi:MAG: hypothetical protein PHV59_00300 [Victivallales bacterium]|nr:hypothetical protein [Victivallales bacterium]
MDFLKKHYEKLILAFFLLVFIFLLLYLIELGKSTHTITREDLQIPTREPNYKKTDFSLPKYQIDYIFNKNCGWGKSTLRNDQDKIYSDLLIPFECARCPRCDKAIPRYYFMGAIDQPRKCPLCGYPLPRPLKKIDIVIDPGLDRDNDGIPNAIELKLGLNPENPDDALTDLDNDGFPNIFEYQEKTKINDPKSHPEMYKRLRLIEFRETLLPVELKTVVTNNKKDPKDWDIQINEVQGGKTKTKFEYLGGSMLLDKTSYKIVKIEPKYEEQRHSGTIVKKDKSKIFLESLDGKYTITMQVDKPVYSPKPKAVIEDLGSDKKYHIGVDDYITMSLPGTVSKRYRHGRTIKYKVVKVDRKQNQVIIEDKKLHRYVITAKAMMPRVRRAVGPDRGNINPARQSGFIDAPPGGLRNR